MNDRDGWQRQAVEPVEHRVAARERGLDLCRIGDAAEAADIGARDEAAGFCRADDEPARTIALDLRQRGVELEQHILRQRVGAGAVLVEQQPDDAVRVGAHAPMGPGAGRCRLARCRVARCLSSLSPFRGRGSG